MIIIVILYYLNIKPTHGYEIQKFLQMSGIDSWTKIQSGSIYYALTKLEKQGCIKELREEKTGSRVRKIYQISAKGKEELNRSIQSELQTPIIPSGSSKFLLYSFIDTLDKDTLVKCIDTHLEDLRQQKAYWIKWKDAKNVETSGMPIEKIAFDMTIDSLSYQILWHEEFLNNIDLYIVSGKQTRYMIEHIDFSEMDESLINAQEPTKDIDAILALRSEIEKNPQEAIKSLDKLITRLKDK